MRDWRALHGPGKEVYFQQEHPPGREAAIDFTHATSLRVTIGGEALEHLLFTFKLSYSGWSWVNVAFGETFEALVFGLQSAFWKLGGVTEVVRHDNLSAATHELKRSGGRALNSRFRDVMDHYGLRSTRIRVGRANENGVAEKGNDSLTMPRSSLPKEPRTEHESVRRTTDRRAGPPWGAKGRRTGATRLNHSTTS